MMTKEYKTLDLKQLIPYMNNPRKNDSAVDYVRKSIDQCGYITPIVCDEDLVILAGHTRLKALLASGETQAEVMIVSGLTDDQKKKYRLLDNKTGEFADWDLEKLAAELQDLDFEDLDIDWGIDDLDPDFEAEEEHKGNLAKNFLLPPFSVLSSRDGEWNKRKHAWIAKGIRSEAGREKNLAYSAGMENYGKNFINSKK